MKKTENAPAIVPNYISSTHNQSAPVGDLPQVIALEESVLGALLIEKGALDQVAEILKPDSFYLVQHALIYEVIVQLFNKGKAIDPRTVVNELRQTGNLEKAGGPSYIIHLVNSVASADHIEDHANIIQSYALRRHLIHFANKARKNALDETISTDALLDQTEQAIFELASGSLKNDVQTIEDLMLKSFKLLEGKKGMEKDSLVGIPTGFIALDRLISGWQKGDVVVLAGRPGIGKTTLTISFLLNVAITYKVAAAFFSLEMSSMQLINRMISAESGLDSAKLKRGDFKAYEWQQLYHKTAGLAQASIYIDDTPNLSLFAFRTKCRRLKMQKNIQIVFLDYLQLMVDDTSRNQQRNLEQQIAAISRSLKIIAKELDITIIVTSQLSRAVEMRGGDKRPQLSDLRASGAIEQDADLVLFLYRPFYYGITEYEGQDTRELAELILAKHRNGPTGTINLRFLDAITKFTDQAPKNTIMESKINTSGI